MPRSLRRRAIAMSVGVTYKEGVDGMAYKFKDIYGSDASVSPLTDDEFLQHIQMYVKSEKELNDRRTN